jgi:hypothetical protein
MTIHFRSSLNSETFQRQYNQRPIFSSFVSAHASNSDARGFSGVLLQHGKDEHQFSCAMINEFIAGMQQYATVLDSALTVPCRYKPSTPSDLHGSGKQHSANRRRMSCNRESAVCASD